MRKLPAFSLTELLAALAIIAILAGLAVAGISYTQRTTRDQERKLVATQIQSALDSYLRTNGGYPSGANLSFQTSQISIAGKVVVQLSGFKSYSSTATTAAATRYYYSKDTSGYLLCVYLEAGGSYRMGNTTANNCP